MSCENGSPSAFSTVAACISSRAATLSRAPLGSIVTARPASLARLTAASRASPSTRVSHLVPSRPGFLGQRSWSSRPQLAARSFSRGVWMSPRSSNSAPVAVRASATEASACPEEFIAFAHKLADASGAVIRRYFRTTVPVDDKADASPVTIADRESETAMRELIEATYPDHGIFGEEHDKVRIDAEWVWVLDPIDGTKSFITGRAEFGTLISLLHNGQPVLGVINQPITNERWVGANGSPDGTTLNGKPVRVRDCGELGKAILYCTTPHMFAGADAEAFERVRRAAKVGLYGCDCYAYAMVASGFADLVVEADLKPYDYCALEPVLRNAGGRLTDWFGNPISLQCDGRVVAAGSALVHAEAVRVLAAQPTVSPLVPRAPARAGPAPKLQSMTGFGSGTATVDGITARVDVRSVNGRSCDVIMQLSRSLDPSSEHALRSTVRRTLGRGTVTISGGVQSAGAGVLGVEQSPEVLREYRRSLEAIAAATGAQGPLTLDHVLQAMRIWTPPEPPARNAAKATLAAAEAALQEVVRLREAEGAALARDLERSLDRLATLVDALDARARDRLPALRAKLEASVLAAAGTVQSLEPGRLEQEAVLLAARADVTEEIVRLRSHLALFRSALGSGCPAAADGEGPSPGIGNKLNFLTQEMNREANTVASKANDAPMAHTVVEIKDEVERMRQQVQNLR
eukprot:tig00022075_g23602.t1